MSKRYEAVIGLEIHVQLKTKSKMFCRCSADIWNEPPNSHTCPVCLGLPGALPFPNKDAIEKTVKVGLALNCKPIGESKFDRKNYFYPDLPKGFQISQYDLPFSQNGWVEIETRDAGFETRKRIGIIRTHLEEDTGKLIHSTIDSKPSTLIDFNRCGIPLMEIVSAPDMNSPQEAKNYGVKIQQIVRYLDVADADMEKGSMRVEPNISLRKVTNGTKETKATKVLPSYKVELKNINSFRSVEKAIEFEIKRQQELLERGETPIQETRGWDEIKLKTYTQRTKEEAFDYRYFPEPDLSPIAIDLQLITRLRAQLPELPDQKRERIIKDFEISTYDAEILTRDINLAQFFEEALRAFAQTKVKGTKAKPSKEDAKKIANWIKGKTLANLNEMGKGISDVDFSPTALAEIVDLAETGVITAQSAKTVLAKWMRDGVKPAEFIKTLKLEKVPEEKLKETVVQVIAENPKAVSDYKSGKTTAFEFLLGQLMRKAQDKLDPATARKLLDQKLRL